MMAKVDEEYMNEGASSIDEEDIRKAAENGEKLKDKVRSSKKLEGFFNDVFLLTSLIKDYWKGRYKTIPYRSISVIAFTILYVMNVVDLLPDFIPGLGLLDDASVIAFCLKIVGGDLDTYREWKESQDDQTLQSSSNS